MEECKTISPSILKAAEEEALKPIIPDDGSGITSIDDMVKLIGEKNGGSRQKGGDMSKCAMILATLLCVIGTAGGALAFAVACKKYNISLENLEAAKKTLEGYLVGCETIEGIALRKVGEPYSILPTCSDVTLKIEKIAVEISELMKKAPGGFMTAALQGWTVAVSIATTICAGVCSMKKGGLKNKSKKYRKKGSKSRKLRKTNKN